MGNAKVIFGNETLIDLTGDTVSANNLLSGATAHNRSGDQIVGAVTVPDTLDDLTDVEITSPTAGQVLKFDGSKWVNGTGGGGASALDDLTDVDITTPTDKQGLVYNGTSQKWENTDIPTTDEVEAIRDNGAVNYYVNTLISQVLNGVTCVVNADSTVTLSTDANGATDDAGFTTVQSLSGGSYRLTGCPAGGSFNNGYSIFAQSSLAGTSGVIDTGNGYNFTTTGPTSGNVIIRVKSGTVLTTPITFKPMISPAAMNLSYDDYQPYAMTNRELTEAVTPVDYDISSAFDSTVVDTIYYANITRVGKIAIARCAIKLKTNISATTKIATLPSGLRPITTINTIFVDDGTQKWGRIALNTSNYNPAGAVYIVPISGNLTSSSTALFTVTYVAE